MRYAWWTYKNRQTQAKGRRAREARDAKRFDFRDVPQERDILALDVAGLKQGLAEGRFTSVDLVHVFGKRCYTIGRELCLSTEEDFENAMAEA